MSKYSDSVKRCSASEMFILAQICFDVAHSLSRFRFCMPTRESAGRRPTWRRSLRVTRPTVSHTKATSSSPHYITSLPTVRPAPSLCGTSSSHLRPWSVAAATSSATRTTSTKRRMLLLLAKVKSCPWWSKLLMTQRVNLNVTLHGQPAAFVTCFFTCGRTNMLKSFPSSEKPIFFFRSFISCIAYIHVS